MFPDPEQLQLNIDAQGSDCMLENPAEILYEKVWFLV